MKTKFLSRSFLETLSSLDLISLADDYGIDIPYNLNRRFIIGELLEAGEDFKEHSNETDMVIRKQSVISDKNDILPKSYNETSVHVILRNPAWAFVWWDIKETELHSIRRQKESSNIKLKILLFSSELSQPDEVFDVQINVPDHKQYILLPPGYKYIKVDLVYGEDFLAGNLLASSKKIVIPEVFKLLQNIQPGQDLDLPPVMELSGMQKLLRSHYTCHRQSFS